MCPAALLSLRHSRRLYLEIPRITLAVLPCQAFSLMGLSGICASMSGPKTAGNGRSSSTKKEAV